MTASEWALVVQEQSPRVWRVVYRLLANQADAADCMQETFVAAWKIVRKQTVNNWPALLNHLATARALDHLRRRVRHARHFEPGDLSEMPSSGNGPARHAQLTELAGQLRIAMAELPRQLGEAYCLRHLNGMSYEEIAAELHINANAVGVALHRAAQRLRVALTPVAFEGREPRRS